MLFASRSLATFQESDTKLTGRKWFDCAECHQEQEDHQLLQTFDMVGTLTAIVGHGLLVTNARPDVCLQEMQEVLQERCQRIRGCVRRET